MAIGYSSTAQGNDHRTDRPRLQVNTSTGSSSRAPRSSEGSPLNEENLRLHERQWEGSLPDMNPIEDAVREEGVRMVNVESVKQDYPQGVAPETDRGVFTLSTREFDDNIEALTKMYRMRRSSNLTPMQRLTSLSPIDHPFYIETQSWLGELDIRHGDMLGCEPRKRLAEKIGRPASAGGDPAASVPSSLHCLVDDETDDFRAGSEKPRKRSKHWQG